MSDTGATPAAVPTEAPGATPPEGHGAPRVTVAGHLCLDLTPKLTGSERIDPGRLFEVGPLAVRLGGSVANTGGGLVDLGFPVTLVATVGDDPLGALLHQIVEGRPGMTARLRAMPSGRSSTSAAKGMVGSRWWRKKPASASRPCAPGPPAA